MSKSSLTRKRRNKKKRLKKSEEAEVECLTLECTELHNCEALIARYGSELRHAVLDGASRWFVWDEKRWKLDEDGAAMRFAKTNARVMAAEADAAVKREREAHDEEVEADKERIAAEKKKSKGRPPKPKASEKAVNVLKNVNTFKKWCEQSQSARNMRATLELAAVDKQIAVSAEKLDADHFLLNVENGTVNLTTGELQPHARADCITKIAPIEFDPKAECPLWEDFVSKSMKNDQKRVRFLQRWVGYSLTGATNEQSLIFHYGEGNNGKSTFITTLHKMLGDYAFRASRGLLFRTKHGNERHPTSIASLRGKRFVSCSEIGEDQELDEELVKDLTGQDRINARKMRMDESEFDPTHKLWLAGNNKPRVKGTDTGTWRRPQLLPWNHTVDKKDVDKKLGDKLLEEASGILNWAIAGCLEWQKHGLKPPKSVLDATKEYQDEQDKLGPFFKSEIAFTKSDDDTLTRSALLAHYKTWCEQAGEKFPVGPHKFTQRVRREGAVEGRVRTSDPRFMTKKEAPEVPSDRELDALKADKLVDLVRALAGRKKANGKGKKSKPSTIVVDGWKRVRFKTRAEKDGVDAPSESPKPTKTANGTLHTLHTENS